MQVLRNKAFSLAAVGLFTGFSASAMQGCDPDNGLCGPCGSVLEGSVSIVNNARVDGFFRAIADLNGAVVSVNADFEANIRALAEIWGFLDAEAAATATIDGQFVADLMAHIQLEIEGSVEGGLTINYAPPKCSAAVNIAVEAQAQCEAQAECDVEVDPGEVSVSCEGQCSGSCEGTCSGAVSCQVEGGISCEGTCEGSCQLDVAASCEGTCRGECMGTCSATNADGSCAGSCDGMCQGTCEVAGGASCSGTCHGSCVTETPSAECMATAECRGSCEGSCSGSCEGTARPPSASADCEASAECEASASAQASANIECTPPSLEINFELNGELSGNSEAAIAARAQFMARITELRVRAVAILQGTARLRGLVNGDFNGDGTAEIDPPPIANIGVQFRGLIDAAASGEIKIAAGLVPCLIPATDEALDLLAEVGANAAGTVEAQAQFSVGLFAAAGG